MTERVTEKKVGWISLAGIVLSIVVAAAGVVVAFTLTQARAEQALQRIDKVEKNVEAHKEASENRLDAIEKSLVKIDATTTQTKELLEKHTLNK